jgi:hypothetical protein
MERKDALKLFQGRMPPFWEDSFRSDQLLITGRDGSCVIETDPVTQRVQKATFNTGGFIGVPIVGAQE